MIQTVVAVAIVAMLVLPGDLPAHHVINAKFDPAKSTRLQGTVTKVDWLNPHVHVFIDVKDSKGVLKNWAVELESVIDLTRNGWNENTVKPGDVLSVEGPTARNGTHQIWGNSVSLAAGGKRVFTSTAVKNTPSARNEPAPRWPDGQPRLGPMPGKTGYWSSPTAVSLVETGVNVQLDQNGLLRNIADAAKVAPFQQWARDVYVFRQRNSLKDDPMFLNCLPPGVPRQFLTPYGIQFLEDRNRQRIFVMMGGANRNWRLMYTDGRAQVGQRQGDDDNPLYYGRSVGKWDGDVLVIDTKGFNEKFWFSNGGLPHTDLLHLTERFSRPNFDTLNYEVTIDDPGAYTRTWSSSWTMRWIPDEDPPEYFCQDNRP
jgi:hypothetical protein